MNLSEYFQTNQGVGILATSDSKGTVNTAIYARPHFLEGENTLAFIMRNRLSHKNLLSNPQACYMFIEKGQGYKGIRLYLTKIKEETDSEKINSISSRRGQKSSVTEDEKKFLVYFKIDKTRPLIGDNSRD